MVNGCELLRSVEIKNKPKMLIGLSQTAPKLGLRPCNYRNVSQVASGVEREPNPLMAIVRNVVSPYPSRRRDGGSQEPLTGVWVEDEGESERRAVIARIGAEETKLLHAKAGRLPSGVRHETGWQKRLKKQGRWQ